MAFTDDYDLRVDDEFLCVGTCYQDKHPFTHMYWAKWALALMGEGFTLQAPAVHYSQKGDMIHRTNVRKNRHHIFELKDEFDRHGRRLGVWPD